MNPSSTFSLDLIAAYPHLKINYQESLSSHTYMKVGGPAELFIEVTIKDQLITTYRLALQHQLPIFILGSGSNIVVSDSGISGLVIKNRADHIQLSNFHGDVTQRNLKVQTAHLQVESGTITNHLVRYSINQGLAGLEYFLGLPGTVGGAIYNNSHYKDQFIGDHITQVTALDHQGKLHTYPKEQLEFAYDHSVFHRTHELIVSATFSLAGGDKKTLWEQATQYAKQRAATQPLSLPSSGCMFKNITQDQAKKAKLDHTSVGYLIDQAGLKNTRIGDAAVSPKHANFIVNLGSVTATDIKNLVTHIQRHIKTKYNIDLELEVFFIGD